MPLAPPSGSNTFVRDHRSTGGLVVEFSRNVESFALNRYVQILPVDKDSGYYLELTVEEAGRVLRTDLADVLWPDGAERPAHHGETERFRFRPYTTERYDYGFVLGDKSIDGADWDVVAAHTRLKAQQAMTARTVRVLEGLLAPAAYDATHVADVTTLPGTTQAWTAATESVQPIRRALLHAAGIIQRDTLGVVTSHHLRLVIGPDLARAIAVTPEVIAHVAQHPTAMAESRGILPGRNAAYGLPDTLYGIELVVEDTVRVTSGKKSGPATRQYAMPGTVALLLSRPGDLVAPGPGPSFATAMLFTREELAVEVLHDEKNRRTEGHVVDDFAAAVTAPATGFLFQNVAA